MRLLISFEDSTKAETLQDALYLAEIQSSVREGRDGPGVWVHDDEDLDDAKAILELYKENPNHERFSTATKVATGKRATIQKSETAIRKRNAKAEREFKEQKQQRSVSMSIGGLTLLLIIICCIVAFFTELGEDTTRIAPLRFMLGPIMAGEVWRIITPIFVHFGFMHIVFNMWWLKDLGTAIERVHSSTYLAIFVLLTGALSNTAQYFAGGSYFGGMSGVVYALFGFVWLRGKFDPSYAFRMQKQTVMFMMGWFVLCFTGFVGNVANAAHAGGLVTGALWGFLSSGYLQRMAKR